MQRDEYYVVTKLASGDHGYDKALKAIEEQVKKLGLAYVDLYIIHSPKGKKILETWDALIEAKKRGLAKSIGVSNFGVDQLKGIKASGKEMPEVNQIELHVWNHQKETMEYCESENIVVMGYCPLARVKKFGTTVVNKVRMG
uniref:NADP-dependent oxidoreductase domain-containing protein n=1 Tax=Lotharella globosa TaxID=91324 RepID=A0A6V3J744_9EUKA|mmetsp:Transcript_8884/g.16880  ORF Transcript_8884/g.16880 Transcript_8884/m.16880 type:complete len:142 (+) Transcript_8884:320-745(+)